MRQFVTPLALSLSLLAGIAHAGAGEVWRVQRVVDGDAVVLERDGLIERVRIAGIDAPELGQPGARAARRALGAMTKGRSVRLIGTRRDRRGWRLADLHLVGGSRVSTELLRQGMPGRTPAPRARHSAAPSGPRALPARVYGAGAPRRRPGTTAAPMRARAQEGTRSCSASDPGLPVSPSPAKAGPFFARGARFRPLQPQPPRPGRKGLRSTERFGARNGVAP